MERLIEKFLVACRYLLVPLYAGLAVLLLALIAHFFIHLAVWVPQVAHMEEAELIYGVLSSLDLVLVAGLIVMVMLSSYANFVSGLDLEGDRAHLGWIGNLGQGALKVKIAVSIATIALVHLLGAFMEVKDWDASQLLWLLITHGVIMLSALGLAVMERLSSRH